MEVPHRTALHRDCHIYGFPPVLLLQLEGLYPGLLLVIFFLYPGLHLVDELAVGLLLLLGHFLDPGHQLLDGTGLAEVLLPHIGKLDLGCGRFNVGQEFFLQVVCIEHFAHLLFFLKKSPLRMAQKGRIIALPPFFTRESPRSPKCSHSHFNAVNTSCLVSRRKLRC